MKKYKVIFLPIWGKQNETIPIKQMEALRNLGVDASYGLSGGLFPLSRSSYRLKPDLISLDWIHQYSITPKLFSSLVKSFSFLLDVWIAVLIFRVKFVWTLHNLQHHDKRHRGLERWVSSFFAARCEKIRVLGPGIKKQVSDYLMVDEGKIVEIPEGPFVGWYPDGATKAESRERLGIDLTERVWLYFGNLRPYKGVENLIEAFEKLSLPNHRLVIAGRPFNKTYAADLERRISGNASISGHFRTIGDDELQIFFGAADLAVLPFKNVLNSGSVILAMGFSKPVVAPAIGLLPFRLQHQPSLLFTESKDLETILKETASLSETDILAIGEKNRAFVTSFYWSDFADMILKILKA